MTRLLNRFQQKFKNVRLFYNKDIHNETGIVTLTLFAIGVGVGLRLFLAYAFRGNFDQLSYEIVAEIMKRGGNVYAETYRYNYSPVWAHVLSFFNQIAGLSHLQFHFVIRSFLTIIDILIGLFVGLIYARLGFGDARIGFSLYLLNPVAILLVGFHGQFENLAMLPLLIATYIYSRQPTTPPWKWIWLLGTLSLLIKHITVFGVWMLFQYTTTKCRAVIMFLISVLFFLATFLPYLPEGGSGIFRNVLMYQAVASWGLARLLPKLLIVPVFYEFMILSPFIAKNYLSLSQARSMEFSGVALLALIFGIGKQYLIIPIIFGSIFCSSWYWIYTLVATCCIAGSYAASHFSIIDKPLTSAVWNSVWLAALCWLLSYFLTRKKSIMRYFYRRYKFGVAGSQQSSPSEYCKTEIL
jgi:hypothetical protein